jgi:hypothetical protein
LFEASAELTEPKARKEIVRSLARWEAKPSRSQIERIINKWDYVPVRRRGGQKGIRV